ncbi:unnamed protein product [Rhodiola kirilowii]
MAARPMVFVFVFLILISVHQLVPLAMAAPVSKHAPTHPISFVSHAGRGIIVGGSTSGLGGGGGKKPRKVMQSRGFEGRKLPEYEAGGSCSRLGGSGYDDCSP